VNSIRWDLLRETLEDYEYLYLLDSLCKKLASRPLAPENAALVKKAENCLAEIPDKLVPYIEYPEDKNAVRRESWETAPDKVYEARAKIASCIEQLSAALLNP
jgi:hypothetical protein